MELSKAVSKGQPDCTPAMITNHPQSRQLMPDSPPPSYTLVPHLDTSIMHLPPYSPLGDHCMITGYIPRRPPAPQVRPFSQPVFSKKCVSKELPQRFSKKALVGVSPKHTSLVETEMKGRSVLEVPGVGKQTAQRLRAEEAELLFRRKIYSAQELFDVYLYSTDKTVFDTLM